MTSPILRTLTDLAAQEDFFVSGGVDLEPSLSLFREHYERYQKWVRDGMHGNMGYLERGLERRSDPRKLLPTAQSIFSVGYAYPSAVHGTLLGTEGVQYARYIRGRDYHLEIAERLDRIVTKTKTQLNIEFEYKVCVDTSALLERTWASFCGLGWIGKNTMLIHPQKGSYFLLGFVLLSEPLGKGPNLIPNLCGNCTRCLTGCPTQAFTEPGKLSSKKCISYQTLENRNQVDFTDQELKKVGNRVAGCDVCQEVCPFNTKVSKQDSFESRFNSQPHLFTDLVNESEQNYAERVKNSSLNRVKPAMFARNLKVCMDNSN